MPTNQPISTVNQQSAFNLSDGWYVAGAVLGTILVSGTRAAPIAAALMGVALIYQLNQLLTGK